MRKFRILYLYGFRFFLYLKLMQLAIHVAKKNRPKPVLLVFTIYFNLLDIQNDNQRHTRLESTHDGCQFPLHLKSYDVNF